MCPTCWILETYINLHHMLHRLPGSDVWIHHGMLMKPQRRLRRTFFKAGQTCQYAAKERVLNEVYLNS